MCPCLGLGPFMLYICDLFSASFSLPLITSLKQTYLLFVYFLDYLLLFLDNSLDEEID